MQEKSSMNSTNKYHKLFLLTGIHNFYCVNYTKEKQPTNINI